MGSDSQGRALSLLRWLRSVSRTRAMLVAPVALLMWLSSVLGSFAWLMVGNVAPSLDGRFGAAEGRYGPVPYGLIVDRELPDGLAVVCSSFLELEASRLRVELVTFGGNSQLGSPVSDLVVGRRPVTGAEVAVSATVSEIASVQPGGVLMLGGESLQVTGLANNPDANSEATVFSGLAATPADASCYVLADGSEGIAEAASYGGNSFGATWWPRSAEAVSTSFRVVIGVLSLLVAICSTALIMAGLFVLGEDLKQEFSTLFALGLHPPTLRRTVGGVIAATGFMLGSAGFLVALGAEWAARRPISLVADITPAGGVASVVDALVGAAVAGTLVAIVATIGSSVPVRQAVSNSLIQQMAGDVGLSARRRSWVVPVVSVSLVAAGLVGAAATVRPNSLVPLWFALLVLVGGLAFISPLLLVGRKLLALLGWRGSLAAQGLAERRLAAQSVAAVSTCLVGLTLVVVWFGQFSAPAVEPVRPGQLVVASSKSWNGDLPGQQVLVPSGMPTAVQIAEFEELIGSGGEAVPLTAAQTLSQGRTVDSQLQWLVDLTSLGGTGADETFETFQVPVYIDTPELAEALGVDARPRDDTESIEIRTGLRGSAERLIGGELSQDAEVIDEPALATSVTPSALISRRDAERIGVSPVDVGVLLVVNPADDEMIDELAEHAGGSGLYSERPVAGYRTLQRWALIAVCPLLFLLNGLIAGVVIRSGLGPRAKLWQLGAGVSVARSVEAMKLAVLTGSAAAAGSVMWLAGPLALRGEGASLNFPVGPFLAILGAIAASVALGVAAVGWIYPYREPGVAGPRVTSSRRSSRRCAAGGSPRH